MNVFIILMALAILFIIAEFIHVIYLNKKGAQEDKELECRFGAYLNKEALYDKKQGIFLDIKTKKPIELLKDLKPIEEFLCPGFHFPILHCTIKYMFFDGMKKARAALELLPTEVDISIKKVTNQEVVFNDPEGKRIKLSKEKFKFVPQAGQNYHVECTFCLYYESHRKVYWWIDTIRPVVS